MICERCGIQAENGARVCPNCGAPLHDAQGLSGASAIRQGRAHELPPVYGAPPERENEADVYARDAGRPHNRRGVPASGRGRGAEGARKKHETPRPVHTRGVNRALVLTILLGVLFLSASALFVFAVKAPQGQLYLMRAVAGDSEREDQVIGMIGEEAAARALWIIGTDYINQGYIDRSIATFERAYALYPDIEDVYNRLLNMAEAYEAASRTQNAEDIYALLYTDIDKKNPLAYRYAIAIMLDQERLFEATDLMQTAYQNTGELSFKSQREQRVPLSPTASLSSGRYMLERTLELLSPQDYDVYYVLDDEEAVLPEDGTLYNKALYLTEGSHTIRAVCVSSTLISDEVNFKYTIYMPVPDAPKCRLAPGEYQTLKRVYLYMVEPETKVNDPKQTNVTIYYTIDGTAPNSESPIYTDEGFMIPGGRVTLRAVAVNGYGKVSNELNLIFRVNVRYKTFFRDVDDQFKAFTLLSTTYDAFKKNFGAGAQETIEDAAAPAECIRVTYDWGEARFTLRGDDYVLYAISTNYASMTGPRNTKIGMKTDDVTALYRDMGQLPNAKGNRGIYYDVYTGYAKYWQDTETQGRLEYVYWREDKGTTTLLYHMTNGAVSRIEMSVSGFKFT